MPLALAAATGCMPAAWGAAAILHPSRRAVTVGVPSGAVDVQFTSGDVVLRGWRFPPVAPRRGAAIVLHGSADNRMSGVSASRHFSRLGFEALTYDSRAHGASGGEACTYGYFEKLDLARAIDTLGRGPVIVIGTSLGGAVALQAAADDARISGVVAASTFADLRSVIAERTPWYATRGDARRAIAEAEREAHFVADAVSPVAAAKRIHVPVLLVHGALDGETSPENSRRIFAALAGPRRLLLAPGRGHNDALTPDVWKVIDEWVNGIVTVRSR